MDQGKHLLHYERVVDTPPIDTHKLLLSEIWWKGGLPWIISCWWPTKQVQPGSDPAGTGAVRQLPSWVQEEIVAGELGRFVEYRVKRSWLPLKYHHARVEFHALENDLNNAAETKTRVQWEIKFTASFGMYYFILPLFVVMINWLFLPKLKRACKQ